MTNKPANQPARNRVGSSAQSETPSPSLFDQAIGRSRYIVLVAVIAVLIVAISLFLMGAIQAFVGVYQAWAEVVRGQFNTTDMTVEFLELVSVMLKAVVFYIIGVGLYSLFIAPLNLTVSLGVETLNDLETKVVSVVIVILAVTYLEHFIQWQEPLETLMFGASLALVVGSLVLFQQYNHRAKEDQKRHNPDEQKRAQRDLFQENQEIQTVTPADVDGTAS